MRELVLDWRAENPLGTGVGWSCSLEPAFRVLSWLWAYLLTLDDPAFDDGSHVEWLEGFHDHGWFLYRHLEYYTSPFNHLAGEASALYCLGVLFPEFREAPDGAPTAGTCSSRVLREQFYADGGSVEQSTFYHHATTGLLPAGSAARPCQRRGASPRHVWQAIERGIEFSMLMQQPDGTTPRIGGADDGKPIRLEHLPLWDFRPYQAIGAVLFEPSGLQGTPGASHEDALWLLGREGAARFDALESGIARPALAGSPVQRLRRHPRSTGRSDANYLCFDCGEQAAGLRRDAIPSAAHGHADCLSISRVATRSPGARRSGVPLLQRAQAGRTTSARPPRTTPRGSTVEIRRCTSTRWRGRTPTRPGSRATTFDGPRCGPWRATMAIARCHAVPSFIVVLSGCASEATSSSATSWRGAVTTIVELTFQFAPGELALPASRASFEAESTCIGLRRSELDATPSRRRPGARRLAGLLRVSA